MLLFYSSLSLLNLFGVTLRRTVSQAEQCCSLFIKENIFDFLPNVKQSTLDSNLMLDIKINVPITVLRKKMKI